MLSYEGRLLEVIDEAVEFVLGKNLTDLQRLNRDLGRQACDSRSLPVRHEVMRVMTWSPGADSGTTATQEPAENVCL